MYDLILPTSTELYIGTHFFTYVWNFAWLTASLCMYTSREISCQQ